MERHYNIAVLLPVLFLSICTVYSLPLKTNYTFPPDFQFGVATASFQIEGAWNVSGKGENIWDHMTHNHPERIKDRSNGDVACDAYHHVKEDVKLMKDLGVDFYRFSLSWSRILPSGHSNHINPDGVRYYNELLDELAANNIDAMVTLYHWDLPQPLQEIGGWPNPLLADYFEDFARVAFEQFGKKVKYWATFNEPKQTCSGYAGGMAPDYHTPGIGDYLCAHTVLRSHARAYHLYNDQFKKSQNGSMSYVIDTIYYAPKNASNPADVEAAERMMQFSIGLFGNAVYSKNGDFPEVMRREVDRISKAQNFPRSRLPKFTKEEIEYIRGTYDFLSINVYTTNLVEPSKDDVTKLPVHSFNDAQVVLSEDPSWPSSNSTWLKVVPWGMRDLLVWLQKHYDNPEMYITENGVSSNQTINDDERIQYYHDYLDNVLIAMNEDGVKVKGYTAWSLVDNFEWLNGYTERFGLYLINYDDANRTRTPKKSASYYKEIIKSRTTNVNFN